MKRGGAFTLVLALVLLSLTWALALGMAVYTDGAQNAGNAFQAWATATWGQTTQSDFDAGVLNQVDSSSSPGDVKLAFTSSSNVATNSPSSSAGGWSNASNAYSDGGGYAYITSGTPSANETYGTYGFSLAGKTISQVRARWDALTAGATITQEYEYYDTGDDNGGSGAWASFKLCQTFSSSVPFTIISVKLLLYKTQSSTGPGTVTCGIYATTGSPAYPTGSALTSGTTDGNTLPTGSPYEWREIDFSSSYSLSANTTYAIVVQASGGNSGNAVWWRCDASSPAYSGGMYGRSLSSGAWGTGQMDITKDNMFRIYGNATEYNDQIRVDVSWDGGTSWSSKATETLTSSETTYWFDFTTATSWTADKLSDTNLKVRGDAYTQGTAEEVRLDWLPVEVTYTEEQYVFSGTVASQVLDTAKSGARWYELQWDETQQAASTDITFEVRASNTPFLKDAAAPSWTSVGGTSPVSTGLPSGQYMQWRATLTTSDSSKTPTLHEVRVYYY